MAQDTALQVIELQQLPIIVERLHSVKADIERRTAEATSLICTEETYKSVKDARAQLTKEFKEYEAQRTAIKSKILEPYNAFEQVYRECVTAPFQQADSELVEKMQAVREKLGKPIKITSGYRCIPHNAAVKGSSGSKHRYGMAADWRMKDRNINPVALGIIATQYFKAVGIYWYDGCAIVHTDTRDTKATWLCDAPKHYPSTTYNTFILPTIRRGSVGDVNRTATKMLQRLLGLTPDGIFGEKTENALLKAQEKHKLAVDGICGPASWRAISGANKYL